MSIDLKRHLIKFNKHKKINEINQRRIVIVLKNMMYVFAKESGHPNTPTDYNDLFGVCKSEIREIGQGKHLNINRVDRDVIIPIDNILESGAKFDFGLEDNKWAWFILLEEHRKNTVEIFNKSSNPIYIEEKNVDNEAIKTMRNELRKRIKEWDIHYGINTPEYRIIARMRMYYGLPVIKDINEYMKLIDEDNLKLLPRKELMRFRKHINRIKTLVDKLI